MNKELETKDIRESFRNPHREEYKAVGEKESIQKQSEKHEEGKKTDTDEIISGISPKKSSAKAAGVKSAFVLSDSKILMTSFGRGNVAVLEKLIEGNKISELNRKPNYSVFPTSVTLGIKGRQDGVIDNPLHSKDKYERNTSPKDILGFKDKLEKRYFPKAAPFADNIHIQLIYNILDVEKILAPFVNNTIYVIHNLTRREAEEGMDIIGNISIRNSYDTFMNPKKNGIFDEKILKNIAAQRKEFEDIVNMPQRLYLGDALYDKSLKRGEKEGERGRKRYYYTLCLLGMMRQSLFHGASREQSALYTLEGEFDRINDRKDYLKARMEARKALDDIYSKRIKDLNSKFLKLAKRDLAVLFAVYDADTLEKKGEMVREYYDYIVHKGHKSLGFSLKTIRELIFSQEEGKTIRAHLDQTMLHKFVKNFDFIAYHYYMEHEEEAASLVKELRAAVDDYQKEKIYADASKSLWKGIGDVVKNTLFPVMNPKIYSELTEDEDISRQMLDGIRIGTNAHYFSKLMYMLTMLLNGKEINELLTKLINKFENIDSFNKVLISQGLFHKYSRWYKMFAESDVIAKELRDINSFARMQTVDPDAKRIMYIEAARVFGYDDSNEELSDYIDLILTKDPEVRKEKLERIRGKGIPVPRDGFRNFIANNVVESTKFKYLVRYTNPEKVKVIAQNEQILRWVMEKQLPKEQIKSYYKSCIEDKEATEDEMRDSLRQLIGNLSFFDFANVDQRANAERNEDKRKKQSIIGLYLAVLYLVVKNLVNINSRYTLAFHCFERDFALEYGRGFNNGKYGEQGDSYKTLTGAFVDARRIKKKEAVHLQQNMENAYDQTIRFYRNSIDHLTIMRDMYKYVGDLRGMESYFCLYHYLVQRKLKDEYDKCKKGKDGLREGNEPVTERYFDDIAKYRMYRKDFVKALNVPFGYNIPRYKNLSIEVLFDMNYQEETEEKKKPRQQEDNVE